tara:strand:+ start:1784 stop:2053 length:270 start_codon:yes stop_codon:yes gene_type:complete
VQFIFLLTIPVLNIHVRTVLLAVVGIYGYIYRHKLKKMAKDRKEAVAHNLQWFEKFEDAEGLEKLKLLSAKAKMKKKNKLVEAELEAQL